MEEVTIKRYPVKGFGTTLPEAFENAEENVGPLGVIHFGAKITTVVNGKIRITFTKREGSITGWVWEIDR